MARVRARTRVRIMARGLGLVWVRPRVYEESDHLGGVQSSTESKFAPPQHAITRLLS